VVRGQLYTVSAPSGAGKTSLVNALLESTENLLVSVSHTTRKMREGEEHGREYFFVDQDEFLTLLDNSQFLEHAHVFDHYYGTSRDTVQTHLNAGCDVLLEIDWQGAKQVREQMPDCRSIFILPPSREILVQRLRGRGKDSEEVIGRRTREAVTEMRHYDAADYLIINDNFDIAHREFAAIITSTRLEREVQAQRHAGLLASLLENS
jgi:guanylate kinase